MSVTVVNDWRFLEEADLAQAMVVIRAYMEYLSEHEPELEQSLWLKDHESPRRYFHIATYKTLAALHRQESSAGTKEFVKNLYPLIDRGSIVQPVGEVVANTGSGPGSV